MITRLMLPSDLEKVKAIHEKHYSTEFAFPDFEHDHYLPLFCVVDANDTVVSAGGVRSILESVIITNKDFSPRDRREALLEVLQSSLYLARNCKYDQIHAFIQDENWSNQLKKYGFEKCKGEALYLPTGL